MWTQGPRYTPYPPHHLLTTYGLYLGNFTHGLLPAHEILATKGL